MIDNKCKHRNKEGLCEDDGVYCPPSFICDNYMIEDDESEEKITMG